MKKAFILLMGIALSCQTTLARPADDLQLMIKEIRNEKRSQFNVTRHFMPVIWSLVSSWVDSDISSDWKENKKEQFKIKFSDSVSLLSSTCTRQEVFELLNKEIEQLGFSVVATYSLWTMAIAASMYQESDVFDQTIELAEFINPTLAKHIDKELQPTPRSCRKTVPFHPPKSGGQCQAKNGVSALFDKGGYLKKFAEMNL